LKALSKDRNAFGFYLMIAALVSWREVFTRSIRSANFFPLTMSGPPEQKMLLRDNENPRTVRGAFCWQRLRI